MTVISDAWNPADHPRQGGTGRFATKTNSAPEATLERGGTLLADKVLLVPTPDGVPYHLRVAETNPLLDAVRADTATDPQEWVEAIEAYFDDPETTPHGDVYDQVRDLFGTPTDEEDIDSWYERTTSWRDDTLRALTASSNTLDGYFG